MVRFGTATGFWRLIGGRELLSVTLNLFRQEPRHFRSRHLSAISVDSALLSARFARLLVSSFPPARRCLLGIADDLAAQPQLKRHGNAVVDGFVYFEGLSSDTFSS